MDPYDRIAPETETHRTAKAIETFAPGAGLPLRRGSVEIAIERDLLATPAGQRLLTLTVHLLARMKGLVSRVLVQDHMDVAILPGVPLRGSTLSEGLTHLVESLSGPLSEYRSDLSQAGHDHADVRIGIGKIEDADFCLGADAWRALTGKFVGEACWADECPLGPYMAAAIGAAEVLKLLLHINFGIREGLPADDLAFSLYDFSVGENATKGPDISRIHLQDLAIAGAGAGGTAALYTLASVREPDGELVVVEPRNLKKSNLNRYLMTDYGQIIGPIHKLDSVIRFFSTFAPAVCIEGRPGYWHEFPCDRKIVVSTVDTPEARWDIQRSNPEIILDGGAMGTIYAVLRVISGGWCLECKHPPDPDVTWKKRAQRWGMAVEEIKRRFAANDRVTRADLVRLADVQGRGVENFLVLEGLPFEEVPALTECGETPLSLAVPNQTPILPLATTSAGIVLAAEVIKEVTGVGVKLTNYFVHDLRFRVRSDAQRFKPKNPSCKRCNSHTARSSRSLNEKED